MKNEVVPVWKLTQSEIVTIVEDLRAKGENAHADELEAFGAALHGCARYYILRGFHDMLYEQGDADAGDEALGLAHDALNRRGGDTA